MSTTRRSFYSSNRSKVDTLPRYISNDPIIEDIAEVVNIQEEQCNPWGSLFYCPLYIYIAASLIGLYMLVSSMSSSKSSSGNKKGKKGTASPPEVEADRDSGKTSGVPIIGTILYIVFAFIFGTIIYRQCSKCDSKGAWLWFIIALLAPFLFVGLILGILSFVFGFTTGWLGTKQGKKGLKGKSSPKKEQQ